MAFSLLSVEALTWPPPASESLVDYQRTIRSVAHFLVICLLALAIAGHSIRFDLPKSRAYHASSAYIGPEDSFAGASSKMLNQSKCWYYRGRGQAVKRETELVKRPSSGPWPG